MPENDPVHHPSHYTHGGIEVADFIDAYNLDWCLANVVKYTVRAGVKDENTRIQDLEKARWYLDRAIRKLKEAEKTKTKGSHDANGAAEGLD